MPLDPQARDFLDRLERSGAPRLHELQPDDARALVVPLRMPREPVDRVENRVVPGPAGPLPIRIYRPLRDAAPTAGGPVSRGDRLPVVVYLHGGGWVVGSISSHDALCRRLCNCSRCLFVSVEYRLAPEHKYPAAVDDAFAATEWVAAHAAEFGGDPERIGVAGDSAGGNLAAVVCLLARDRRRPHLVSQTLIYPITDYFPDNESSRQHGRDYFLTHESIAWFWNHYLSAAEQGREFTAAPLRAARLSGLPAALVLVAEFDPLRDEGLEYAARLEQAGVPVQRFIVDGQIHGFLRRLDLFDRAARSAAELGSALGRLMHRG